MLYCLKKIEDSEFRTNPNWRLIPKNKDSQFKLPNNVGIAPENCDITTRLNCRLEDCPVLLKSEITERFNVPHLKNSHISIITISLEEDLCNSNLSNLTRHYLHAAFSISDRLLSEEYWVDFIHPYTGLPAISLGDFSKLELPYKHKVYHVSKRKECKDIVEKISPSAITLGNIFTNASPTKTDRIQEILDEVIDLHCTDNG
ncbi:cobalamin trafficking protein CblD-like [Adelges cooleyi]|uniref:cobalamin trafficking protein CblD-like n=1 Tax=Adelges cooleyi TaxID=133065 RepID=UPI00217F438F|nr:cobalamin trafficking protein CblD-like [Adelges cooleyi]